jgi:uncharacterized membrane protein YbhN (UPF0104 family)
MPHRVLRPEAAMAADPTDMPAGVPVDPAAGTPTAWRRWLGHAIGLALIALVAWVVLQRARTIDWAAVGRSLQAYPLTTLCGVLALVALSHAVFGSYELLARRYVRHGAPPRKVWAVGLVCFAFNLNLGSLIGGYAFRWRLYARLGLKAGQIARVLAFDLVTNWIGFFTLAGLLLASGLFELPQALGLDGALSRGLGGALLLLPLAYLGACWRMHWRELVWRGRRFEPPPPHLALAQIGLSALHWLLTGAIIQLLLPAGIGYPTVLGTLMSAAIAGAIVHVPGGLGVLEAVFVATLEGRVPEGPLVAALLAYRAAFYLLPLVVASALHLLLEARARRRVAQAA